MTRYRLTLPLAGLMLLMPIAHPVSAQASQVPAVRAEPNFDNKPPAFPEMLKGSGVSGIVRMRVVVDSNGRSVPSDRKTITAAHQLFEMAVTKAIADWRFTRALNRGQYVRDTLEISVDFLAVADRLSSIMQSELIERRQTAPGQWLYVVSLGKPVAVASLPDSADQLAINLTVLDALIARTVRTDSLYPARIACLTLLHNGAGRTPTLANLVELSRSGIVAVAQRRCPRTLASPFRIATSDGSVPETPAGEDPFEFTVQKMQWWSGGQMSVDVKIWHATSGHIYACVAERDPAASRGWKARCTLRLSIAS